MGKNDNKYINRELSWIEFNKRVLYQSIKNDVPLLEKFNFLGITSSNLDEFIMVRVGDILYRKNKGLSNDISGMNVDTEYGTVIKSIRKFKQMQYKTYRVLEDLLNKSDIKIMKRKELSKEELDEIGRIFNTSILPLIIPVSYDSQKEFPALKSKQMNIAVLAEDSDSVQSVSFIALHDSLPKMYSLKSSGKDHYISLEDIIYLSLSKLFVGRKIISYGAVKILRDASDCHDNEGNIFIVDKVKHFLTLREFSKPVAIDISPNMPEELVKLIRKIFEIGKDRVFKEGLVDYTIFKDLKSNDLSLKYTGFSPQYPSDLIGISDMFTAMDNNDILIHHPYETFDPIIKLMNHAADDKDVLSIRQTLYRVSSESSEIVEALCRAAQNGKDVTVLLELKARFDEDRNISLIDKLKLSGVKLIFGDDKYKTHCKLISIVRQNGNKLKLYTHVGTGNYNEITSRVYTDVSYFTSNFKLGQDVISLFNILSGFSDPSKYINTIFLSPFNLRDRLYKGIDNEIKNAKNGKNAALTFKVNSFSDKEMIDRLYKASKEGVKVNIFVRGICSMKPINDNIMIKSLVGRFLEHSRIYLFANNGNPDVFISSADLLTRNLDKRFELLIPIRDKECKQKLLKILSLYYKDGYNTFKANSNGEFLPLKKNKINIHDIFMTEAIENYKLKTIPKMDGGKKRK